MSHYTCFLDELPCFEDFSFVYSAAPLLSVEASLVKCSGLLQSVEITTFRRALSTKMPFKATDIVGGTKQLSDGNRIPMIGLGISRIEGQVSVNFCYCFCLSPFFIIYDTLTLLKTSNFLWWGYIWPNSRGMPYCNLRFNRDGPDGIVSPSWPMRNFAAVSSPVRSVTVMFFELFISFLGCTIQRVDGVDICGPLRDRIALQSSSCAAVVASRGDVHCFSLYLMVLRRKNTK